MNLRTFAILMAFSFVGCGHALGDELPVSPQQLAALTARRLETLSKSEQFSGVVLIAKDGRPILRKAFGFSNLADRVTNRVDTRFNVASMGKMFTGVAIMQLVQSGRLSLDDHVGKYLPDYPNVTVRDSVTVRELLTHTSGLGNFWEEYAKAAKDQIREVADYLPLFENQPLLFAPGTGFAYSNSGFTVLGRILEKVTGTTYADFVRGHIYALAGMTSTDAFELDHVVPNLATGYARSTEKAGVFVNNLYVNVMKGGPAGGSYSTADDLLSFANALMNYRLLSKEVTLDLISAKVPYGSRQYSYGFTEELANGHRVIGHGGGNIGISNELMIFPDLGYTVIILTNGDVDNFWEVQAFLKKQLLGSTADTDSYYFTKQIANEAAAHGYASGLKLLNENPRKLAVKNGLLDQTGQKLLFRGRSREAIDVFRLNTVAHPEDAQVFEHLAEAYDRTGNKEMAVESYGTYLAMEPTDAEVETKLLKLISR
jgi:D-alanyl-D-alanine carboxypeptidase